MAACYRNVAHTILGAPYIMSFIEEYKLLVILITKAYNRMHYDKPRQFQRKYHSLYLIVSFSHIFNFYQIIDIPIDRQNRVVTHRFPLANARWTYPCMAADVIVILLMAQERKQIAIWKYNSRLTMEWDLQLDSSLTEPATSNYPNQWCLRNSK